MDVRKRVCVCVRVAHKESPHAAAHDTCNRRSTFCASVFGTFSKRFSWLT